MYYNKTATAPKNEEKYCHDNKLLPDFLAIGSSGVDLFFVISGFVMVTITRGWFQESGAIPRFIYHRLSRIYPLYWFYSALMLIIFLVQQKTTNDARVVDMVASFLLLPQKQLPLLVVGWTLVHEMYFYIVFSLFLGFRERWLLNLLIFWGTIFIIGSLLLPQIDNSFIQLITNPLTLEFIAGSGMALINFSENSSYSRSFMYIAFTLWILGYGICKYLGLNLPLEPSGWLRLGLFGLPATLLVLCLVTMEKYSNLRLPKWLILIGNASFSLYLSHLLIIATIGRIWQKFGIIDVWANGLILMVMFFCAILFGLVSFQLLEQPLLKATRRDW